MKKRSYQNDPLVGIWHSADEFGSVVEYRVSKSKTGYLVVACDTSDGELADIFESKWDPAAEVFSFAAHWNSTGRFSRCRLRAISEKEINLTYTYTDNEVLIRAKKRVK